MNLNSLATRLLPVPAPGANVNFAVTKALTLAASTGMSTSAMAALAKLASTARGTRAASAAISSAKGPTMSRAFRGYLDISITVLDVQFPITVYYCEIISVTLHLIDSQQECFPASQMRALKSCAVILTVDVGRTDLFEEEDV